MRNDAQRGIETILPKKIIKKNKKNKKKKSEKNQKNNLIGQCQIIQGFNR